jgi:hypothetical protein
MGLFNKQTSSSQRKGLFGAGSSYDTSSIDKQIENANTRIDDAGYQKKDTDNRNWFEKSTNLPQGQNWFFDTLEILGRPGGAVKNVVDKNLINNTENIGEAAWKGFSGQEKVSGADIAGDLGVENKVGKFALGLGLDIATDPLTYVPGGVLVKGAKGAGSLAAKPIKAGYNALESVSPALKTLRETRIEPALESGKDALGYMFNPKYKIDETLSGGKSSALDDLAQKTNNSRQFMQEENLLNLGKIARDAGGVDKGVQAGRIVEAPLKVNLNAEKTVSDLIKGKPLSVNKVEGDLPDIVGKMNQKILESPVVKRRIAQKTQQITNIDKRIGEIENHPNPTDRMVEHLDDYEVAKERVTADLANIKKGIHFNPNDTATSFNLINPKSSLYRRALGDTKQFIDDISPRGSFDQIVKPELASNLKPIVTQLLREGTVKIPTVLKGKPEQRELKRLFGDKLQTVYNKKSTTFKIDQKNPDSMYFNLEGAKPVIPESLTDASKPVADNGLQFNDVQFTNRIQNVNVPRPSRELSNDPKIQKAAQKLVEKSQSIREFAKQNGIDIPELEGHMTHVWSAEERSRKARVTAVDSGQRNTGNPNKSILNARTLAGSAEDINDRVGRNHTEMNAFFASAIGQKRLIDYIHAVNFRRRVLSDHNFAIPFQKGMNVPKNAEVIDTNNYKFLKDSGDILDGVGLKDEVGGQYMVTKAAKQLLDRYQSINTDEGTKAFMKMFDTVQSFWKRGALFSLGYHARNQAGAMFNNYVGGINPMDLAKYSKEGFEEVAKAMGGKESTMFNEYRRQGLSSSSLSQVEFAKYGEEPEKAIERTVKNVSRDTKGQITQRLNPVNAFQTSQEVGNFFDQANRFALYKWARETKKMSPEEAAKKVREVQFDYSQTTPFESRVVARVLPFYRWMKNNIPFQIRQFVNDPRKYEYLNKARLNAQDVVGLNDENIPDYMKDSFTIPVSGENGKGKMLGLNLPLGDLTKLSRPGKTIVDAVTPLLKTPAELALNYNTFRGKPIQAFEGQEKKYQIPFTDKEFGLPIKDAYALEQATGQIGRGLSGFLQKPESVDQDTLNRLPSLGISSLTKPFDTEKYAYYEKLDQLKQMQDLIRFIEQQTGDKPRTVNEIKKANP